jgi:hypothetical protein
MAQRVAASSNAMRVWVTSKPEVWPVIACMGIGGAWLTFVTSRFMFLSPDTQWSRSDRGNMWRTNFAEGKSWSKHRSLFVKDQDKIADTSVIGMEAVNRWIGGTSQRK